MPELISTITSLFSSIFSILIYVGVGFGLWKLATKCEIPNPWLAWIPFGQTYTLGAIADHYYDRCENRTTSYRKKLLVLEIVMSVLAVLLIVALMAILVIIFAGIGGSIFDPNGLLSSDLEMTEEQVLAAIPMLLLTLLGSVVVMVVAIIYLVFHITAMHKVFKLFDPNNATLFTVLSVFFSIAQPILYIVISNNSPRYPAAPEAYMAPLAEPVGAATPISASTDSDDSTPYSL